MIEVRLQSGAPKVGVGVGELLEELPRQLPPQAQGVQGPRK
jgi:hypothetical protein